MHFPDKHWQRISWLTLLLAPASALFALVSGLRRAAYRLGVVHAVRLPVPVVVVGNISAGGTGKTPAVLWLARQLRERGHVPAIVSRGYGGQGQLSEVTAHSDPAVVGDEPVLLAARAGCPLAVGRDRVAAARLLLMTHPQIDVILSDDGLQHYRLGRDVEIALVDGERGLGNRLLLPAGPLREPPARLHGVDAIVVHGTPPLTWPVPVFTMSLQGSQLRNLRDTQATRALTEFAGKRVHAVAGIGNPQRFFERLRLAGLGVVVHPFADHHAFLPQDLDFGDDCEVIMTEKDAIKCRSFARPNWWMLPVDAQIDSGLADLVIRRIAKTRGR